MKQQQIKCLQTNAEGPNLAHELGDDLHGGQNIG